MSKLRCHISISLDGFVAGPNQSEGNPLGEGAERLHEWVVPLAAWRQSHGEQWGEDTPPTHTQFPSSPNPRVISKIWREGPRATLSPTESRTRPHRQGRSPAA